MINGFYTAPGQTEGQGQNEDSLKFNFHFFPTFTLTPSPVCLLTWAEQLQLLCLDNNLWQATRARRQRAATSLIFSMPLVKM